MKKYLKSLTTIALALMLASCAAVTDGGTASSNVTSVQTAAVTEDVTHGNTDEELSEHKIELSGTSATLDGESVQTYDYTWHCDPSVAHDEVKNAPAEYYAGNKPETDAAAYIDSELYYYPELPEDGFRKVMYDGEAEWAYYYTDGVNNDYIFATLPALGSSLPTQMMHSEEEAAQNKVLHITKPGTYTLSGEWNGQIRVDLGDEDETFTDPNAKVTLILNGVSATCTVAPAIIFQNAYECDNEWEARDTYGVDVDTSDAGVNVIIADGSENNFNGTNVFRMLKTKYKNEDDTSEIKVQKKMRKTDAAFYSYVTMNIDGGEAGDGVLNVTSGFEGLDSELHLTLSGGKITVNSQDDGMNVNEDHVSVISFNGADVTINGGLGAEGDGVDSNGYIAVKAGTVSVNGIRVPDNALDSEDGVYYTGGTVIVDGEAQSLESGTVVREIGGGRGNGGMGMRGDNGGFGMNEEFDIKDFKEKVADLPDSATLEDVMNLLGGGMRGERPDMMPGEFGGNGNVPPEPPRN